MPRSALPRFLAATLMAVSVSAAAQPDFEYDRSLPTEVTIRKTENRGNVRVRDVAFRAVGGGETGAYLVSPGGAGPFPAILFVHWYSPESKNSNRTQFLDEAIEMAGQGTVSLLVDTMWSDPAWFKKRNRAEDFDQTVRQVREFRRALDVLSAQPGVDAKRILFVGHDFGAMFGAVLAGVDRRPKAYALQAGNTSFSRWYLLSAPKLPAEERTRYIDQMYSLDPQRFIGKAAPAPVLLQFGRKDWYVPESQAEEFFAAAHDPKQILWYEAGHELNAQAAKDRQAWLARNLR